MVMLPVHFPASFPQNQGCSFPQCKIFSVRQAEDCSQLAATRPGALHDLHDKVYRLAHAHAFQNKVQEWQGETHHLSAVSRGL